MTYTVGDQVQIVDSPFDGPKNGDIGTVVEIDNLIYVRTDVEYDYDNEWPFYPEELRHVEDS